MNPYTYRFIVDKDAIDFNGHVHNVTYLAWMIEAATKHSESVGAGHEVCLAHGGIWVAKSHHIEYKKPAFENDTLQMKTWIEDIGKILSTRCYEISRIKDVVVICEGKTEWVFVDNETMRPRKIPNEIRHSFTG
ncbi:MAG TPA: acyl-CoA thioesterase [Epsilonproteobacteria bacterium]|nr:acyl-CoA thioesterase [Campylobacterota bacterium]